MGFLTFSRHPGIELRQIQHGRIRDGECGKMWKRQHEHPLPSQQSTVSVGKSTDESWKPTYKLRHSDVTRSTSDPKFVQLDEMESFWLAETLK